MTKKEQFILFCFESFRAYKQLKGSDALAVFKKHNVFDYLNSGFEVLHTQGQNFLMNDINEYIQQRQ